MSKRKIAVFLGPSCPAHEARAHLEDADYFPPAARGSFYNIINDGYGIIVLIDGLFYGKFAVWHKEIMFALDSGIEVIGASSMGALRAAELQDAGMTGVGTIFGWYRDGVIDGDDEVALLHEGAEDRFTGLTIPLVNLRWHLAHAVESGLIGTQEETLIVESARRLCFTERTADAILHPLADRIDVPAIETWLAGRTDDLKKNDAIEALKLAGERQSSPAPAAAAAPRLRDYELIHVNAGIEYYVGERLTSIRAKNCAGETPLADYLARIPHGDAGYRDLVRARRYHRLIVGWARELRLDPGGGGAPASETSIWDPAAIPFAHRRATGLTLIEIAREDRDARLGRAVQQQLCGAAAEDILAVLDRRLESEIGDSPIEWQRMIRLDGRLLYTLWALAGKKHIVPDPDDPGIEERAPEHAGDAAGTADAIMSFAAWIDKMGTTHFGYMVDPAREILLAYQYLDCLDDIGGETA